MQGLGKYSKLCSLCGRIIPWGEEHVSHTINMLNGTTDNRRYCRECCNDDRLAILFRHVMELPVKAMNVVVAFR